MKVMMAIRMRGIDVPPIVKANTSLGLGHGTVVEIRTVMYDSKKQLKMKVSLRRKIHIMALPQQTFLNARWSEAQSAATPFRPPGCASAAPGCVSTCSVIGSPPSSRVQQQTEQHQPHQEQEVPVHGAE